MQLSSWFVKILFAPVAFAPMSVQLFWGRVLGHLWFDILRIRRRVALENLRRVYPDWSEEERVRVARASCVNLGMSFIEFCRWPFVDSSYQTLFEIEGLEHLRRAQAKGRGVMLLSLHLGNGDWATAGLNLAGLHLNVITKRFSWSWANAVWFSLRTRLGTSLIDDRNSSYKILKCLKRNEIVVFVLDQFLGPPLGVKTKFFGIETGTPSGLAVLTRRAGASVVPVYTVRKSDGRTLIHFDAEIPFVEFESDQETIQKMTQVYCDKLEEYVRKFPEQWMWVHRRWKKYRDS
jgi:KDO2-lipid IV(A) lauroyltransferase